ncbi:type I DNA topoisomerase [Candidatus Falkowbacteria bacterium HGW-Falkowbacteria-1]|uniref:DNA topoisomerase 1 n=1 Tax=Candidatus Falkowbacteria bacterium HGW-Falkowbacteria-1 TaxID=2013768 RepID=A0A2N2EA54_9BACT|nr:MAG: type I DNA topoisomerase [Candidatus Falkowbacteria bacterium HGW-Falkowbacteria-1]
MDLIIVESPTKAKTISKFLDKNYKVESSFGHVRDLPQKELGVDLENNFEPKYIIPSKAKTKVSNLKKLAKTADSVILAADEDREGEAIAWHLFQALGLKKENSKRIVFHEITKDAILEAIKNPREIDQKMVDAQQARRVLDRLVGYKLSPLLWKKVAKGLSAGRVQSVAVRLIVEREREIKAFVAQEYWDIEALLEKDNNIFSSKLLKINKKSLGKFHFKNEEETKDIIVSLKKGEWEIENIESKESKKNPAPPFITSTLQQGANRRFGFSAKQTMMVAQKLYELGHITYMRTDSLNLSEKFKGEAESYIKDKHGDKYLPKIKKIFKNKSKNAQEAHEAIRPSNVFNDPEKLSAKLDKQQAKLYQLIWQRAVASQMSEAVLDTVTVDILAGEKKEYIFRANGQTIKFNGYLEVYPEKVSENELPKLEIKNKLNLNKLEKNQHFTQAPSRYSDASLVKEMEKHGIGRPSTYAPTIATIIDRNYVNRDDRKKLFPTDIAFIVIDLLVAHFNNIVNYKFTAEMENDLDKISLGEKEWRPVLKNFWDPFYKNLKEKDKELDRKAFSPEEESNEICDKCGAKMIIKTGRYGKFLACSAFPECKNIKSIKREGEEEKPEDSQEMSDLKEKYKDEKCEKCGAEMIIRKGRFGLFLGCSAYPKCKNLKNVNKDGEKELELDCPLCKEGKIVKKFSRRGVFYACNAYPKCKNAYFGKPTGGICSKCGSLIVEDKNGTRCSNKSCE